MDELSRETSAHLFGWSGSVALHAAVAALVYVSTSLPDADFEFQLPSEIEFGVTDAVVAVEGGAAAAPHANPRQAQSDHQGAAGAALDGGVSIDGGMSDGGAADAAMADGGTDGGPANDESQRPRRRRERTPVASADPESRGEGEEGEVSDGSREGSVEGQGVAFLPEGSQIALRIDVTRIRHSPFADDVRELLGSLPDWQAVIGGSGVQPLEDLDRLLIATPNFDRARVVMAGRATGGSEAVRAAAEQLAAARGTELRWRRQGGFPVAEWHNQDVTERVVALIGPRHFVIARPDDLPRVLAVARARAADGEERPADALLAMEEGAGLSIEVEGARAYYRSRRGGGTPREIFPERLRLALKELADERVGLRSVWMYEDDEQAERAATYFDRQRRQYANPMLLAMAGFGALFPILDGTIIHAEGSALRAEADLTEAHVRNILRLGQRALGRRRPPDPHSTPSDSHPTHEGSPPSTAPGAPAPIRPE